MRARVLFAFGSKVPVDRRLVLRLTDLSTRRMLRLAIQGYNAQLVHAALMVSLALSAKAGAADC